MNSWIFQGNPDHFQVGAYIADRDRFNWTVRQKQYASEMQVGDEVYVWQSEGKSGATAGIIAVASITAIPAILPEDEDAKPMWLTGDPSEPELRVKLRVIRRCLGSKEIVQRKWLQDDPVLKGLLILRLRNNTNYKITAAEAQRLSLLTRNTGRDWNRDECLAALWAYSETEGKPVSQLPGSAVADVALTIGRVVCVVHDRLMGFRAIDPRDQTAGLTSTNQLDHAVWAEFYDTQLQALKKQTLDEEYRHLWKTSGTASSGEVVTTYKDFGEAPNDDPTKLQMFARKVRGGQEQFRKNLIELYGGRCAISGWAPEEVLEAAHISEHAKSGINHTDNGILLRSDFHLLLDAHLLRLDPDTYIVSVNESLSKTPYWQYHDTPLPKRKNGSQIGRKYLLERFGHTAPQTPQTENVKDQQ
jgi:hypothetical protein